MMASRKVASAYVDLQLQTAQFKAAIGESTALTRQFSASMREEMEHSRESVRLMSEELGLGIPRGLQQIISKLPGVSTAMSLAFDSVVVFALIDTVVKVTEKIVEFTKKTDEGARKNAEANARFSDSLAKSNAELAVSLDKVQDHIAVLEHKPKNGVKDALDDAAVASEKLSKDLDDNIQKMRVLLSGESAKWYQQMLGAGSNAYSNEQLEQYQANQRDVNAASDQELKNPKVYGGVDQIELRRRRNLAAGTTGYYNQIGTDIVDLNRYQALRKENDALGIGSDYFGRSLPGGEAAQFAGYAARFGYGDQSAQISSLTNQQGRVGQLAQSQWIEAGMTSGVSTEKGDEEKSRLTAAAKAAADKWMKAQEDAFKAVNVPPADLPAGSAAYDKWASKSPQREQDFLLSGPAPTAAQGGSEAIKLLTAKVGELNAAMQTDARKQNDRDYDKNTEAALALGRALDEADRKAAETAGKLTSAQEKYAAEVKRGAEQMASIAAKHTIDAAHIGLANHSIGPRTAALVEAQAHATEANAKLVAASADLLKLEADAKGLIAGTPEYVENATTQLGVRNQIAGIDADASRQAADDAARTAQTTFSGRMTSDLDKWIEQSTDLAGIMGGLFTGSINQVNDAILKVLTTKPSMNDRHPFRAAGHAVFTDVAGAGLKGAEGELMKALGLHGRDVKHVIVDNMPGAKGAVPGVPASMFDSMANPSRDPSPSSGAGASSFMSGVLKIVPFIAGAFGDGGTVSPGGWNLVGEHGPELLQVGSTSRINNARDTAGIFGAGSAAGSATHNWNIDARGATDPAAINMAVQRGIVAAAPHIIAASHEAEAAHKRRLPNQR
jgi:hypothetical protein